MTCTVFIDRASSCNGPRRKNGFRPTPAGRAEIGLVSDRRAPVVRK
jgi:hypothetical protein